MGWLWGRDEAMRSLKAPAIGQIDVLKWAVRFLGLGSGCPHTPSRSWVGGSGCKDDLETSPQLGATPWAPHRLCTTMAALGSPVVPDV